MVTSAFNAKRFAGKPLKQPLYQFDSVATCNRNLEGSTLYEINNRDDFVDATAEMVLLCNEATRRSKRPHGKRTSKPLSLEYIADRLVSFMNVCMPLSYRLLPPFCLGRTLTTRLLVSSFVIRSRNFKALSLARPLQTGKRHFDGILCMSLPFRTMMTSWRNKCLTENESLTLMVP